MTVSTALNKLPTFNYNSTAGENLTSKNLIGNPIIIYFYPKDNTPGCSQEAQDFRDHFKEFKKQNAIILGVSRDSLKTHENFINKLNLPFALISDPEENICKLFDVIQEKNMYGKKYLGIERSTFLFDAKGKLLQEWRKVKVKGHVIEVLSALRALP